MAALEHGHEVTFATDLTRAQLLEAVAEIDGLIVRSRTQVDAELLAAARRLKVVGRAGIGVDNIDVEAASARGVLVCNVPGATVVSVAEHTMALLLALVRNLPRADTSIRAGRWERSQLAGRELHGKRLAIVGFGRIGRVVAERAQAFGMEVSAYDPYVAEEALRRTGVAPAESLTALLADADVVSLHAPLTDETEHLIDAEALASMRPDAVLVNTARGGLVDEAALVEALDQGRIAGAAIDVFAEEPPGDSPLLHRDDVVLSPHLGATTAEAQARAAHMVADAVARALVGELVEGAINVPVGRAPPHHLEPYLNLARHLGRLVSALREDGVQPIVVELEGRLAEDAAEARDHLTLSVLVGCLTEVVDQPVSYVNVAGIAEEQGLASSTLLSPHAGPPALRVRSGRLEVAGTIGEPGGKPRLIEVWGYQVDVELTDAMVFLRCRDQPGIVGRLGTSFGTAGVNIAGMQVARDEAFGEALLAMAVDAPAPPEVVADAAAAVGATVVRTLPPSRLRTLGADRRSPTASEHRPEEG